MRLENVLNSTNNSFWDELTNWLEWNRKKKERYSSDIYYGIPQSIGDIRMFRMMRKEFEYMMLEMYLKSRMITFQRLLALLRKYVDNKGDVKAIADAYSKYVPDTEIKRMLLELIDKNETVFENRIKSDFNEMINDKVKYKFIHLVLG
jgi:translation elongation factor EF-G